MKRIIIFIIFLSLIGCSKYFKGSNGSNGLSGINGEGIIYTHQGKIGETQNGIKTVQCNEFRGNKPAIINVSIDNDGTGFYQQIGASLQYGAPYYEVNYVIGEVRLYYCSKDWDYYVSVLVK